VPRAVLFSGYREHLSHNPDKCASLDYDNDGRLDVLVSTSPFLWYLDPNATSMKAALDAGTFDMRYWKFATGHPHLLRNGMPSDGQWLKVELRAELGVVGVAPVPIGSVVEVETPSGTQRQVYSDAIRVFVQGDKRLHFGLGHHAKPTVRVRWSDGLLSKIESAPACVDGLLRLLRTASSRCAGGVCSECLRW